jgi:hypothetical protein
LLLQ